MVAVIPAAGYGTRFLPASKCVPKEMLPIGDKPAIQRIVEEAVAAGATRVIVITSPDKPSLKAHFSVDERWHRRLAAKPALDAVMTRLEDLGRRIEWVDQTEQRGLGHAVLQAAERCRGADSVLVLLGDALISGCQAGQEMAELSRRLDAASIIGCERVPPEKVSRYGILALAPTAGEGGVRQVVDLVEKPTPAEAPSDCAIAGRYLLDTEIFSYLRTQSSGKGGEIQLTDAIRRMIVEGGRRCYAYVYPGRRHDIGNPQGYFEALRSFLT